MPIFRKVCYNIRNNQGGGTMETTEFHDTIQAFSIFLLNKGRKSSTIKRYVYDIEDFGHWLEKNKSSLPVIYGQHFVQKTMKITFQT